MRSTIRDVARHAGVSIATVSRVLHDHEGVRPHTRERVTSAMAELSFTPSRLGRSLAERRHTANGIVFPDLSGPYYAEVVLGYECVAAELGRSVLILSTHGRAAAPAMVEDFASRCDGLVLMGRTVSDEVVRRLAARHVPLVLLARPPVDDIDSVKAQNRDSAAALTRHLREHGKRQLVFVGDPEGSPDVTERWAGITEAASAGGAEVGLRLTDGFGEEDGLQVAETIEPSALPDAFLCANDELALGLMAGLRARRIDVPGDVAVTGWDDVMAARYAGLTTVRQPMRELGASAARLLDERITGSRTEPRHEVLPTELVIRTSCGHTREEQ